MAVKLEVGKSYLNGNGEVCGPMIDQEHSMTDHNGRYYTKNGRRIFFHEVNGVLECKDLEDSELNLVEEYIGPAPKAPFTVGDKVIGEAKGTIVAVYAVEGEAGFFNIDLKEFPDRTFRAERFKKIIDSPDTFTYEVKADKDGVLAWPPKAMSVAETPEHDKRKQPHKHAELIKAWADGAQIQSKAPKEDSEWQDSDSPYWHLTFDYRIKPPEVSQWRKDMAKALEDGKVVEFLYNGQWHKTPHKAEDFLDASRTFFREYRIRPEPKPDHVEFYKWSGHTLSMNGSFTEWHDEDGEIVPQIKVIWDSEGNLKSAEVLNG